MYAWGNHKEKQYSVVYGTSTWSKRPSKSYDRSLHKLYIYATAKHIRAAHQSTDQISQYTTCTDGTPRRINSYIPPARSLPDLPNPTYLIVLVVPLLEEPLNL